MKYIGVSDCRMQEGSLRCDVNISVRKAGTEEFGTRTEIKNMNSFTFIQKAVDYEMNRQIDALENGEEIVQETRRYNDGENITESMRGKEDANDYRYFREPDLVTIATLDEEIEEIRKLLPELPDSRKERYIADWDIPEKDAALLTKYRKVAEYFEAACEGVTPKTVCNLILGQIFRRLATDAEKEAFDVKTTPAQLQALVKLIDDGKLRMNLAKPALEQMLDSGKDAENFIDSQAMAGMDDAALKAICQQAVDANPAAVKDYLNGKEKAVKALVGFVMKNTKGAANPQQAEETIIALIKG
jgi:aspartyl-tRNA(Asn)/glutamyl-tRNA(Gln) amidotransferase subunit B